MPVTACTHAASHVRVCGVDATARSTARLRSFPPGSSVARTLQVVLVGRLLLAPRHLVPLGTCATPRCVGLGLRVP